MSVGGALPSVFNFSCVALSVFVPCCLEEVAKQKKEVAGVICVKLYKEEKQKRTALLIYVVRTHFCACVLTF